MARYLVKREQEIEITRTITYEAEIEVSDDTDETEVLALAKRLRDERWRNVDEWDESDRAHDSYEVAERLDGPEPVRGKPQDYGLEQEALFA
ncbi:MAG: hypothetical protein ACXWQR_24330 [Ktedonobacterales bacterium]